MRLVFTGGGSHKFWEGAIEGCALRIHFGRVGTAGQRKEKVLASPAAAERELAKLIAEKLRKGYVAAMDSPEAGPTASAASAASSSVSSLFKDRPLLELAVRLGADPTLIEEIELAVRAPASYRQRFAERLGERGIRHVDVDADERPDLAWFALIDGLIARGRMRELDHRSAPDEVLNALFALDPAQDRSLWKGYVRQCDATGGDEIIGMASHCLEVADRRLRERGLALAYLSIASDSTPVVMVPADEIEALESLARAAGVGELGPLNPAPRAPPARLDIPDAPASTPRLRVVDTIVVEAPWSAVTGFFALPQRRAVMLTVWGSDRRSRLWMLSPAGVESQPVGADLFPEWASLHPVDHACALFRAGDRFGLMSNGQFRLWENPGAAPRLGSVTPPLFRDAYHRPPNVSFGGASDDPRVVVVGYFAVGSLEPSQSLARLELEDDGSTLRHRWLERGGPLVPRREPPEIPGVPRGARRPAPFPPLTAVAHARGSTFIATRGLDPRWSGGFIAKVLGDGSSEVVLSLPAAGSLRPTSCGRFVILTEETPPRVRQSIYSLVHCGYAFPFDPEGLPQNLRLLDRDGDSWWARDADAPQVRLHLCQADAPPARGV